MKPQGRTLYYSSEKLKVFTEKSKDEFPNSYIADGLSYDVFAFTNHKLDKEREEYYTKQQIEMIKQWLACQPKRIKIPKTEI